MDKKYLTEKWLSNELNETEEKAFNALEEVDFYKDIVESASQFKASNFSAVPDFATFKERLGKQKEDEVPVKKLNWFKPLLSMASVFIIGFGLYYFFFSTSLTQVTTAMAEKTTVELPDMSKVVLNANSEVAYNKGKWEDNREIKLKGEAFFDVAKGAKFDVVTSAGVISVLGTEFNVKQRGDFFEVACYEGKVRVVTDNSTHILNVGDTFKVYKETEATGTSTFSAPQWTNNMSTFQRIPVFEVLAEVERQYNVKLTTENVDTDQLFTGSFIHTNLEGALKGICEPMGLEYTILQPNKVVITLREK